MASRDGQKPKGDSEDFESAKRFKDLFIDILSHDLLNPVGVIENIADILEDDGKVNAPAEIKIIKRNVRKIEEIINSVSEYGKLEAGEGLEKSLIDLNESIKNAIEELETLSGEKRIKVNFKPSKDASIKANPMIGSVFVNLISNAIKYSPNGSSVTVTIEDGRASKIISVADEGEGIADAHKESIFDRFTRRDKSGVKGTGLGLAIVKRVVELHEGRVWVEDGKKGGSVFKVQLPANA